MAFSIILHKVRAGAEGICSSQEAIDLIGLLKTYSTDAPDKNNEITIDLDVGHSVIMRVWPDPNKITGCWFKVDSLSDSLIQLVYKIAVAGNFVIINTNGADSVDDPLAIVLTKTGLNELGEGAFASPYFCKSVVDLLNIFSKSFGEVRAFEEYVHSQVSKQCDYEWKDIAAILDALQIASGQAYGKHKLSGMLNHLKSKGRIKVKRASEVLIIESMSELQSLFMSYDSNFRLEELKN